MPPTAYLADVLDEHLDELGFLWNRWRAALLSPDYTLASLADLEERVRARLEGARVPGARARPRLVELLHGPDADLAFAAAYVLLRGDATEAVLAAFAAADDGVFTALAAALAHSPLPRPALARVRALLSARPASRAAAAAEVLAFHHALDLTPEQLRYFLEDEDAAVRTTGWRVAMLSGVSPSPKSFAHAVRDPEPSVTRAALEAGAWCGVPGVLAALRQLAEAPPPERLDALYLLAVLGTGEDARRIRALVEMPALGPGRFRLAGAFGDPGLVDLVLAGLENPDPACAAAAGAAFTRLIGVDASSGERAIVPPAHGTPPDEFEAEFLEEVALPDAALARSEWETRRASLAHLPRICRGLDAAHALGPDARDLLDMESRRDLSMRQRFHGGSGTALALEVFPQADPPPA